MGAAEGGRVAQPFGFRPHRSVRAAFQHTAGQTLARLVDLIAEARLAVDEVIEHADHVLIETILNVSAEQVAGAKTLGESSRAVRWHGR